MKRAISATIVAALAVTTIPAAAWAQSSNSVSSSISNSAPHTQDSIGADKEEGKNNFRNIFFGLGDNAKELAANTGSDNYANLVEYASGAIKEGPEYENMANSVIRDIEAKNTDFFSNFERDITSGDPYSVEDAIDAGSEALATTKVSEYGNETPGVETQCAFSLVWTLVGAVNIGLAVNVEAWVFVQTKFKFAKNKNLLAGESGELIYEKMVAGISETYAK